MRRMKNKNAFSLNQVVCDNQVVIIQDGGEVLYHGISKNAESVVGKKTLERPFSVSLDPATKNFVVRVF